MPNLTSQQILDALDKRMADPANADKFGDAESQAKLRAQFEERLNTLGGTDLGTYVASKGFKIEGINDQPTAPSVNIDALREAGVDIKQVDAVYEDAMDAPLPRVEDVPVAEYPPKPPYSSPTPPAGPKHRAPTELEAARARLAELEAKEAERDQAAIDQALLAAEEEADRIEQDRIQAESQGINSTTVEEFLGDPDVALAYDSFASINAGDTEESVATEAGDPETWTEPGEAYPGQKLDEEADAEIAAALGAAAGEKYAAAAEDSDPVKHPAHYRSHPSGVECNTIARHYSFNIGSAIKYLWRHGLKSDAPAAQDLRKAIQFLEFELEKIEAAS